MFLGIDIGGTTISLGVVDRQTLISKVVAPSFRKGASLQETYDYLESLIRKQDIGRIDLIGIGVPSVVDAKKGIVYDAINIPAWQEAHLGEELERRLGIKVKVNNDANCYALGAWTLSGKTDDIFVGVTLGTGVGTGLVVDGRIINGRNTGVGEL